MFLQPLLAAPIVIQAHAFAALGAFLLGIIQLAGVKGNLSHRVLGWIWVGMMAFIAVSSFWIHQIKMWGDWSPIHLLSVFTLLMLCLGVLAARRRKIRRHSKIMKGTFVGALVVAGAFTFFPGRIMYDVLFGTNISGQ